MHSSQAHPFQTVLGADLLPQSLRQRRQPVRRPVRVHAAVAVHDGHAAGRARHLGVVAAAAGVVGGCLVACCTAHEPVAQLSRLWRRRPEDDALGQRHHLRAAVRARQGMHTRCGAGRALAAPPLPLRTQHAHAWRLQSASASGGCREWVRSTHLLGGRRLRHQLLCLEDDGRLGAHGPIRDLRALR